MRRQERIRRKSCAEASSKFSGERSISEWFSSGQMPASGCAKCHSICRRVRRGKQIRAALAERPGKCSEFRARKTAVAVVKEYRYGLFAPCRGDDQIDA